MRLHRTSTALIALAAAAACAPDAPPERDTQAEPALRYDAEYPAIGYSTTPLSGPIARLEARLARGEAMLELDDQHGFLPSLLEALDIDPASQVLVFSRTSFQVRSITPETPRALYFNDDTYVAALHDRPLLEIASMDPNLGPVFHTLEPAPAEPGRFGRRTGGVEPPRFERQMQQCLRCHDSLSMSGGGVPRFLLGSGYIGARGQQVAHEGWILTNQQTPMRNRWGGWYVTGRPSEVAHLGNLIVGDVAALADLDGLRVGTLPELPEHVDAAAYLTDSSDIVALLVLQHQADVQNLITRVSYDVRSAMHARGIDGEPGVLPRDGGAGVEDGSADSPAVREDEPLERLIAEAAEPLVEAMLFIGEAELTDRVAGTTRFAERFEARGPHDGQGRTLRELDLERRLLRYPLSWLVYSEAFLAMPEPVKVYVYRRIAEILRGEDQRGELAHLDPDTRRVITEVLLDTHPELAAVLGG